MFYHKKRYNLLDNTNWYLLGQTRPSCNSFQIHLNRKAQESDKIYFCRSQSFKLKQIPERTSQLPALWFTSQHLYTTNTLTIAYFVFKWNRQLLQHLPQLLHCYRLRNHRQSHLIILFDSQDQGIDKKLMEMGNRKYLMQRLIISTFLCLGLLFLINYFLLNPSKRSFH